VSPALGGLGVLLALPLAVLTQRFVAQAPEVTDPDVVRARAPEPPALRSEPSAPHDDAPAKSPAGLHKQVASQTAPADEALAPEDRELIDRHGGNDWSDRCFVHLKQGNLDYAQAACQHGLEVAKTAWTKGALLYNLGLIEEKRGNPAAAATRFSESLAARPSGNGSATVKAALARVSAEAPPPSAPTGEALAAPSPTNEGMISISPGTFTMGSNDGAAYEQPARPVTITRAFLIDRLEVTAGEYLKCVNAGACSAASIHGPSTTPKAIEDFGSLCTTGDPAHSNYPVNCVDRKQATAYCAFVGKRLPTEAEWEYAARGVSGQVFPWGATASGCNEAVLGGCLKGPGPVGEHPAGASPFGVLDMAGNVAEWVSDGWSDAPASLGASDPAAAPGSFLGVLRGGSWDFSAPRAHVTSRLKFTVGSGHVSTGVRCAR
jgi:formylglycine-generating enzyme required for sulfatase activity